MIDLVNPDNCIRPIDEALNYYEKAYLEENSCDILIQKEWVVLVIIISKLRRSLLVHQILWR